MSDRPDTDLPLADIIWPRAVECPGHEPNPDCDNCNGRGCMACVFREWHDHCEDDCPSCCVCDGCEPRPDPTVDDPTVDDLLDWLVDQGWTWTALKWQNQVTVRVIYIETGVCAVHDLYGPTLFDALEQAVRLVHYQTEA